MKGIMKLFGILFGAIAVILVAGAVALTMFFDPNDYKKELAAAVKENTGRDIEIKDKISLTFFPWLGVELGNVTLSNAKGFGDKPFLKLDNANIRIKLLPLLRKEVEMDTVVVHGLNVNLMKNKQGVSNWADLAKPGAEQKPSAADSEATLLAALAIGGLDIRDANVIWDDQSSGTKQTLEKFNLKTGTLSFVSPVDDDMTFSFNSSKPEISGDITLLGKMSVDMASQLHSFKDMQLITLLKGKDIPGNAINLKVSGNTVADLASQTVKLDGLTIRFNDTSITGGLGMKRFDNPEYVFNLTVDSIDVDRYLPANNAEAKQAAASPVHAAAAGGAMLPVDTLRKLNADGKLVIKEMKASGVKTENISIELKAGNGLIVLYPLSADMYRGKYTGNIRVDARGDTPKFSMDEKMAGIQVGDMLQDFAGKQTLTGTSNIHVKLSAVGNDTDTIRRNMNGDAAFEVKDGKLNGVNNVREIMNTIAILRGGSPTPADTDNETVFSVLSGSINFVNGVGTNNDLLLDSPALKITGAGTFDLVKEWINYKARAVLPEDFQMDGIKIKEIEKLKGKPIPVSINCSMKQIDAKCFSYSLDDLLRQELEDKIKEKLFKKLAPPPQPVAEPVPAPDQATPPPTDQTPQEQPVDPKKQLEQDLKKKLIEGLFK